METLDFHVTRLDAPVAAFSGGQRQAVAIGRAIFWNARLVIMDEPTAALGVPEQRKVISLIQSLKAAGKGIIFISHNLRDIFEVADRIVVFRRGENAGERKPRETSARRDRAPDGRQVAPRSPVPVRTGGIANGWRACR